MLENYVSVFCAEGHSPNVDDLVEAMFLEGARVLGLVASDAPVSVEAQQKILLAAASLTDRLAFLLENGSEIKPELERGN